MLEKKITLTNDVKTALINNYGQGDCQQAINQLLELGITAFDNADRKQAEQHFLNVLGLSAEESLAYLYLAYIYSLAQDCQRALIYLQAAIKHYPDNVDLYVKLGFIYQQLFQPDHAFVVLQRGLALAPEDFSLHLNMGWVCFLQNDFDQAGKHMEKALVLQPDNPVANFNKGNLLLKAGDVKNAWPYYNWRFKFPKLYHDCYLQASPWWSGQDLAGKRIVLFSEQGFGDTLMFVRFAEHIKAQGAIVTLACQPALHTLLLQQPYIDEVIELDRCPATYDFVFPLLHLPSVFEVGIDDLAEKDHYLMVSEMGSRYQHWQTQLASLGDEDKRRIGFVWSGSFQQTQNVTRQCPLTAWQSLIETGGAELSWVSLQRDEPLEQLESFPLRDRVLSLGDKVEDFLDTALLLTQLDILVTVDTAIAHLAGALGCRTLLLASRFADWRWFTDRTDSPWYPSVTIFRQTDEGDWSDVLDAVAATLGE